jgi:molybdopterin-guanine dinucleotide biosynthesis protein A
MKMDKAFLNYHGKAQCEYAADMLLNQGYDVYISCQEFQKNRISKNYKYVLDKVDPCGPLGGIISVMETHKQYTKWLVLGCDYPLLNMKDVEHLISASNKHPDIAYFDEYYIPTLAIYQQSRLPLLQKHYKTRQFKMQLILEQMEYFKLKPLDSSRLKSFDTIQDYKNFRK